jgi:phage minor structural protein
VQFAFLDMAGKTLFLRDDAERAQWTQEEMNLEAEFPRVESKVVSTGQRILFYDPATGAPQVYEVKQAKTLEPDHYQSVTAEHICISELSDEHTESAEITDKKASEALAQVLTGTLWQVGTVGVNPTSNVDISRGSVWQAVLQIKDNFNIYITPRVTVAANGAISRYLDIESTAGVWNGLRLSIDKNMLSPSVTYDDSELVTALYGYGGTTTATSQSEESKEITFADVVWSKTASHPAKPAGQTYLEDPDATAAYGRNGRARFGYFQNTDILDPNVLLQKTWEALQISSKPAISIEGTVEDLYRMGYADEPLRLHDIALVEVQPAGYKQQIQIIRMAVDLLDPTQTSVTIGAYIPNIV